MTVGGLSGGSETKKTSEERLSCPLTTWKGVEVVMGSGGSVGDKGGKVKKIPMPGSYSCILGFPWTGVEPGHRVSQESCIIV